MIEEAKRTADCRMLGLFDYEDSMRNELSNILKGTNEHTVIILFTKVGDVCIVSKIVKNSFFPSFQIDLNIKIIKANKKGNEEDKYIFKIIDNSDEDITLNKKVNYKSYKKGEIKFILSASGGKIERRVYDIYIWLFLYLLFYA